MLVVVVTYLPAGWALQTGAAVGDCALVWLALAYQAVGVLCAILGTISEAWKTAAEKPASATLARCASWAVAVYAVVLAMLAFRLLDDWSNHGAGAVRLGIMGPRDAVALAGAALESDADTRQTNTQ